MRRLGMTLSLLLLVFLGAEWAIRVMQSSTYGIPVLSLLPGYRDTRFQLSPFLVFGPRVGWEIPGKAIPELARFNDEGFRLNGPVPAREPGEYRIIAVGGSTTENVWNEAGIHWPLVAQCRLRDQGYPVRILNAAMSAYSTAHSLVRLQFGLVEHDPDMVLVMHAVNDLTVNYAAAALGREVDPHYLVKYGAKGYTGEIDAGDIVLSRVGRGIRNRLWTRREASLPPSGWVYDLEQGVQFFSRNLRSIAHWAAAEGVDLGLLTMPYSRDPARYVLLQEPTGGIAPGLGVLPEQHIFSRDMDRYNKATTEVAQEEGVLLLDMATDLQEREGDLVDPVHYSTAGILRFGEIVAITLAPSLPVPARNVLPGVLRECALLAELEADSEAPGS